jgi:succinate-semialdehyde dehydrogenase/glutarate-semialdehyde dehydrogenase
MSRHAAVHDPRTGEVIEHVELLTDSAVEGVVVVASTAFQQWRAVPVRERCEFVRGIADVLDDRPADVARRFSRETGKTEAEAEAELDRTVETFRWAASAASHLSATAALPDLGGLTRHLRVEPAGPVLAIVPSNFPAVVAARKVGPALAMGCSVVLKAPETAPSVVRAVVAAADEAGLPDGVLQLVVAGPEVSGRLAGRAEFRVVSFTGSPSVGRAVAAAAVPGLAQCVLELGGHAPAVVLADADLQAAVDALVPAKFRAAGQSCAAPSRMLVDRRVVDEFVERFVAAAPLLEIEQDAEGRPGTMGPLHSRRRRDEVHELVVDAVARGARLRLGGAPRGDRGHYYPATVLTDVPDGARVLVDEPFGPLAAVMAFDREDDAVALANAHQYRLGAFVFGAEHRASALAELLDAGRVSVNCATGADPESPLSGRGQSGYGYEGGDQGLLAFARLKAVHRKRSR